MAPFYHLLLVLLTVASECRADSPLTVSASLEDTIALPCGNIYEKDLRSSNRMRWIKYSTDTGQNKIILSWPETSQHAKNVKWGCDEKGTKSLILTNSQKSDEGIYSCEFCEGWDCSLRNVSLRVKDCKVLPAVKVTARTPFQLNCSVDIKGDKGPLSVSWELLKGGEPSPLISERVEVSDTSLVIKSPSVRDSAWYRCSYTYGKSRRCFDIRMLVQVEDVEETTFQQAEDVEATTIHQANRTNEQSGDTHIATLSSVVAAAVVTAVVTAVFAGVYIYRRRHRAVQRPQWLSAGEVSGCVYYYEPEGLLSSDDPNQQINNIYQQLDDDGLHTFSMSDGD